MSTASLCKLSGAGLEGGLQGTHCEFNVEMPVREMQPAGGSELSMHIRGPSKAVISSRPIPNGYTVDYFPSEPGEYILTVLCDNDHVPSSPFTVQVKSNPEYKPVGNHLKCSATGPGMKGGIVGKACLFSVDVKDAGQGKLALALTGPSKTELTRSDSSSGYEYQFVPKVAGEYTLKIAFSDKDIPGSPFLIHISETEQELNQQQPSANLNRNQGGAAVQIGVGSGGDPSKCKAYGDGLYKSVALKPTTFYVNCREAGGGGKLHIRMTGPSKTDLVEVEKGSGFQYTTKAPGTYELVLLFNEVHIPGSPFTVIVSEDPNHRGPYSFPNKVKVHGGGLRAGRPSASSTFYVDLADAGAGTLSVEIQGPEEAPIQLGKHDNGQTVVSYVPPVPGEYVIAVKFSNQDISGSPFTVSVQ